MNRIVACCAFVALIGCSSKSSAPGSGGKVVDPPKPTAELRVELASVTLADQCGGALPPPVVVKTADASTPKKAAPPSEMAMEPARRAPAAACPVNQDCGGGHRQACEQTSMQLSFTSTHAQPSKVEVKKIELLDDGGKLIGELTAQPAMRWGTDKYEPWDQSVPAGETVSATYALSSLPYDKMGGRHGAHDRKFQLRVTFAVGGKDQVVEKKAIAPTMLEPAVPT